KNGTLHDISPKCECDRGPDVRAVRFPSTSSLQPGRGSWGGCLCRAKGGMSANMRSSMVASRLAWRNAGPALEGAPEFACIGKADGIGHVHDRHRAAAQQLQRAFGA